MLEAIKYGLKFISDNNIVTKQSERREFIEEHGYRPYDLIKACVIDWDFRLKED